MSKNNIHYVYKIIDEGCYNIKSKLPMEYIGVRKFRGDIKKDKYLGSGRNKYFNNAKIFRKDLLKKVILFDKLDEELAYFIEEILVDKNYINSTYSYNQRTGGKGGFDILQTPEMVEKAKLARKLNGTDQMIQCNTEEAIAKGVRTRKKNKSYDSKYFNSDEFKVRSLETKIKKGTNTMYWTRSPEVRSKAKRSIRLNSINKYPELNSTYQLIIDDKVIKESTLLNFLIDIYGNSKAVSCRGSLLKRINQNTYLSFKTKPEWGKCLLKELKLNNIN